MLTGEFLRQRFTECNQPLLLLTKWETQKEARSRSHKSGKQRNSLVWTNTLGSQFYEDQTGKSVANAIVGIGRNPISWSSIDVNNFMHCAVMMVELMKSSCNITAQLESTVATGHLETQKFELFPLSGVTGHGQRPSRRWDEQSTDANGDVSGTW